MSKLLTVNNLSVSFVMERDELQAVRNVSFSINKKETVAVVGESGAGKSQVFHALLGLQSKNARLQGSAKFLGMELINQPDKELNKVRGTDISIIFQDPMTALNPYLKIGKQLTEVLQIHREYSYGEAKKQAITALTEVKIPHAEKRFDQYPHELSGGMRQRVIIAMSLLGNPKLIIADEPTTALDVTVQTDIISLLRSVHEKHQTSLVLITHDIPLVAGLCDRIIIMYAGRIVESATLLEIHQQAKHPYTRALLEATPSAPSKTAQAQQTKLTTIPGQPPHIEDHIKGCAFAPRCYLADDQCLKEIPEMIEVSSTQSVACFHRGKS